MAEQGIDPTKQYYDYLKRRGMDVPPTYESFKSTLSDKAAAEQYYGYLQTSKQKAPDLDIAPDFDSFYTTLSQDSAKKKYGWLTRLYNALRAAAAAFYQSWKQA